MKDPLYKKLVEDDFKKFSVLRVSGFPTRFIEIKDRYHEAEGGYPTFSQFQNRYLSKK